MYIILFLFWIILNGRITLEIVLFGLVISAFLYAFICRFMDYNPRTELAIALSAIGIIKYGVFLVVEVIKANLLTARLILSFDKKVEPLLLRFDTDFKTDTAKTMLANSITLTPGTITVEVDENVFLVHGLDQSFLDGIEECEFVTRISEIEEKTLKKVEKHV